MKGQVLFQMVMLCIVVLVQGEEMNATGKEDGNIWDMLIAQDSSNEPIVFERAPTPLAVYGPPAPAYRPPSIPYPIASASNIGFSLGAGGTITPGGILQPHVEILKLLENFIKLKGEIGTRFYAVVADNWELIKDVFNTVVSKLGTLHAFTVNGIIILRKILEFALRLFGNWQITVPNVSVDFSSLLREVNFNNL